MGRPVSRYVSQGQGLGGQSTNYSMKIKTQNLTGPALAYAVSLANGWEPGSADMAPYLFLSRRIRPNVDWSQGGSIIERENLAVWPDEEGGWFASADEGMGIDYHGPTLLIAAMRCYVASKLGDEVEIPEELQ